ncbi:hypothetical protein OTU49_015767 [Cherax quadricarinatus]|uniref:C2H2-type domain-containing protein n=1 Tax=Cherax quadricarinatus TaxID=27406 RepID=A0AAW0YC73_CHEQU
MQPTLLYHTQEVVSQLQQHGYQQQQQEQQGEERTNYFCHVCGKEFHGVRQRRNLKRHMMIHWGEKPFHCPFCPHRSNQKGNLKTHILKSHPDRLQQSSEKTSDLNPQAQI